MIKYQKGVKYVFSGKRKTPNNVVSLEAHKLKLTEGLIDQPLPAQPKGIA